MSKLLVAGERPAGREQEPFTNRAGQQFRDRLAVVGIDHRKVTFFYPETTEDVADWLKLMQGQYLILSGNKVTQLVYEGLRTGQCHGRIMAYDGHDRDTPLTMSVFHHEAFVRAPKQMGPVLEQELARFRYVAQHRDDWLQYVADTCVKCRGLLHAMTPQRVAYCQAHWRR